MTLVAGEMRHRPELCIPKAVNASVNSRFPIPVVYAMAFPAEQSRFILWYYTSVMVSECIRVVNMMAVQAAEIEAMSEIHIFMGTEGEVCFFRFCTQTFFVALAAGIGEFPGIKQQLRFSVHRGCV